MFLTVFIRNKAFRIEDVEHFSRSIKYSVGTINGGSQVVEHVACQFTQQRQ